MADTPPRTSVRCLRAHRRMAPWASMAPFTMVTRPLPAAVAANTRPRRVAGLAQTYRRNIVGFEARGSPGTVSARVKGQEEIYRALHHCHRFAGVVAPWNDKRLHNRQLHLHPSGHRGRALPRWPDRWSPDNLRRGG